MSANVVVTVLSSLVELIVYVLKRIDKKAVDELRRRLDDDPCGVLIDKVGGNKSDTVHAHTEKHDSSDA